MPGDVVAELLAQAITYDLEMPADFRLAPTWKVEEVYNGIGPDWLPKVMREWMTDRWGYFAPAALIHDWEYQFPIVRDRQHFTDANERFRRNCHLLLRKGCPWYKRWLYKLRADKLADACEAFGFDGYMAAGK